MKKILFIFATTFALFSCEDQGDTEKPNVVLFYIDDMGYGDIGSYGATGFTTPNIDKLASEGMRFTHFYSPQAVCSASRAGLLTGCYPNRVGINGALFPNSQKGLNPQEKTIAEMFKEKGYATGIFGKWHLGHHEKFLPLQHGFDEYVGLPYSNDMWPVGFDGKPREKSTHPVLPLIENNKMIREINTLEDQDDLTTIYTDRAVNFIDRNNDKPFFLYVPHTMVHVPLGVSDKFRGKSEQGMYGDVVMEIDWSVGEIIKRLKQYGIYDNTLIIFTSDNGPWLNYGNHGGSTNGLAEGKLTTFEGGQRVPAIFSWPNKIPSGTVSNRLACAIDILPTLTNFVGGTLPENKIDGVDISEVLLGDSTANPRNELYYYLGNNRLHAVRKGSWKLVLSHVYGSYNAEPGADGFPKPTVSTVAEKGLYDLRRDPGEDYNVIEYYPDVVTDLEKVVEKARVDLGDFLTNRKGKNVREAGWLGEKPEERKSIKHLGLSAKVIQLTKSNEKYSAAGPSTLLDGDFGTVDEVSVKWLGYEGENIELVIDLGKKVKVKDVNASFLRKYESWIFLPPSVKYLASVDNRKYDEIASIENLNLKKDNPTITSDFRAVVDKEVRYIKIVAESIGTCPDWHQGAGGKGWLFIDEVVIR